MRGHAYHPACGCYACGRSEEAAERDDELRSDYAAELITMPDLIGETALNETEAAAVGAAVAAGNLTEVGRLYVNALNREADERVEQRAQRDGCTLGEAAARVANLYRPMRQAVAA